MKPLFYNKTYGSLAECQRPFISAKTNCTHKGEKSLKVISTVINCETVQTLCDNCGMVIETKTDCR